MVVYAFPEIVRKTCVEMAFLTLTGPVIKVPLHGNLIDQHLD